MSLISLSFRCTECDHVFGELLDRAEREGAVLDCPSCETEGSCAETMSVPNITRASYVDSHHRFDGIRQSRQLTRIMRQAKHRGDNDVYQQSKREIKERKERS